MLRLINDFQVTLNGPLTAAGEVLPLASADAAKLDLTGGGEYLLTLADSLVYSERSKMEIVRVSAGLAIAREQEGTTAQDWGVGDYVMCLVTAGVMAELAPPTIVAATPPTFAPQVAGQQWILDAEEFQSRYVAKALGSVFGWRWAERETVLGPTQQISIMTESPAGVDLPPHVGAQVYTFPGLGSGVIQQLNLAAMPFGNEMRFDVLLQPSDAVTVDLDVSLIENPVGTDPYVSTETMPAGVTVSVVNGRVRIACTDNAQLRVEIYAGSVALDYEAGVHIYKIPFPEYIYIN